MDTYIYLLLTLIFLTIAGLLLFLRKDLAPIAIKLGWLGGAAGIIAELFYFRDYWRPPTIAGTAKISIEDFLIGFAIMVVSVVIYVVITNSTFKRAAFKPHKNTAILLVLLGLASLFIFSIGLGLNSVLVSLVLFIFSAEVILLVRPDLLKVAVVSALSVTAIALVVYMVLFNIISPEFWERYWLLTNTSWGVVVLGNIPLTEIMWWFTWTLYGSILYPFITGAAVVKRAIV